MGDTEKYELFSVKINYDKRIDKSRVGLHTPSSLHPAEIQDAGKPIQVVAKITATRGKPPELVEKLMVSTDLHR